MYYFQANIDLDEPTRLVVGEEDMPEAPEAWTLEDFQEFLSYSEDEIKLMRTFIADNVMF